MFWRCRYCKIIHWNNLFCNLFVLFLTVCKLGALQRQADLQGAFVKSMILDKTENRQKSGLFWVPPCTTHWVCTLLKRAQSFFVSILAAKVMSESRSPTPCDVSRGKNRTLQEAEDWGSLGLECFTTSGHQGRELTLIQWRRWFFYEGSKPQRWMPELRFGYPPLRQEFWVKLGNFESLEGSQRQLCTTRPLSWFFLCLLWALSWECSWVKFQLHLLCASPNKWNQH